MPSWPINFDKPTKKDTTSKANAAPAPRRPKSPEKPKIEARAIEDDLSTNDGVAVFSVFLAYIPMLGGFLGGYQKPEIWVLVWIGMGGAILVQGVVQMIFEGKYYDYPTWQLKVNYAIYGVVLVLFSFGFLFGLMDGIFGGGSSSLVLIQIMNNHRGIGDS